MTRSISRIGAVSRGLAMMFWLRSAFWLSLVFSQMPLERSEIARTLNEAQTLAAHEEAAAKIGCNGSALACGAVSLAVAKIDAAAPKSPPDEPSDKNLKFSKIKTAPVNSAVRPSASSLTEADLAPPWRGHKPKRGA
jgi:hypothetical protein